MIKDKHIAITGILNFYKRNDAFSLIKICGGIPQDFVTTDTDYLVLLDATVPTQYAAKSPTSGYSPRNIFLKAKR